jgi:hypothetical protein
VDDRTIDALKARERFSEISASRQAQEKEVVQLEVVETQHIEVEQNVTPLVLGEEEQHEEHVEEQLEDQVGDQEELTGPPTDPVSVLRALRVTTKPEKENHGNSIFDRQINAQRVDFGDGFDTQPTLGPSNRGKGKQRAQPSSSSSRKRVRPVEVESELEDDAFESADRTARVKDRRQKAPVAKKICTDPSSSGVPTSYQLPSRIVDEDCIPGREQEESFSEAEAPDMTEEAPPSTYQAQRLLAMQNRNVFASQRDRKPRTTWSEEEEEAFVEYMGMLPGRYAAIKTYDREEGGHVLEERTQVNLKDKARTMATNMIK